MRSVIWRASSADTDKFGYGGGPWFDLTYGFFPKYHLWKVEPLELWHELMDQVELREQ